MMKVIGILGMLGMVLVAGGNSYGLILLIPSLIKLIVIDLASGGKDVIL